MSVESGAESLKSAFAGAGIHMLVTQVDGHRGHGDGLEVEGGKLRDGRCPWGMWHSHDL